MQANEETSSYIANFSCKSTVDLLTDAYDTVGSLCSNAIQSMPREADIYEVQHGSPTSKG